MIDPSQRNQTSVDVKQLMALVTVAEVGSVTAASARLHLVQPVVTRQIRALDDEFEVLLLKRSIQGMRPTEAGTVMTERARRALVELAGARPELRQGTAEVAGTVAVGLLESVLDLVALPLVAAVREHHPAIARLRFRGTPASSMAGWTLASSTCHRTTT